MNTAAVDKIVNAVLYEGYLLYPYRRCVKNERRMMFGCVYPRDFCQKQGNAESFRMQTECLLETGQDTQLEVQLRFLQFVDAEMTDQSDVLERKIETGSMKLDECSRAARLIEFEFAACTQATPNLRGILACSAVRLTDNLCSVSVSVENVTPCDDLELSSAQAQQEAFVSTHTILQTRRGKFVSLIDPPSHWRPFAAKQKNQGAWPVLVGDGDSHDTMLASPIILYDYPQVAGESPGDLFDATEIDEILSLRVMTLSEDEKQQIRKSNRRAAAILNRTESLPEEQFRKLHGAIRGLRSTQTLDS